MVNVLIVLLAVTLSSVFGLNSLNAVLSREYSQTYSSLIVSSAEKADEILRERGEKKADRKKKIDSMAAAIILEDYLHSGKKRL